MALNETETKRQIEEIAARNDGIVNVTGSDPFDLLQTCEWALELSVGLNPASWARAEAEFPKVEGAKRHFPLLSQALASPIGRFNEAAMKKLFRQFLAEGSEWANLSGDDSLSMISRAQWALEVGLGLGPDTWVAVEGHFKRVENASTLVPVLAAALADPLHRHNRKYHETLFRKWLQDGSEYANLNGNDGPSYLARCEWALQSGLGLGPDTWDKAASFLRAAPSTAALYPILVQAISHPLHKFNWGHQRADNQRYEKGTVLNITADDPTRFLVWSECALECQMLLDEETKAKAKEYFNSFTNAATHFPLLQKHLFEGWVPNRSFLPSLRADTKASAPSPLSTPISEAMRELDQMIGLAQVKEEIKRVKARVSFDQERNIKSSYRHFMFTGNPGTGKTTVARILGRILHEVGFLKTTNFVEASRSTLVAGYVGQTAGLVQEHIDKALDGVLFIDEAHMLASSGSKGDFGHEALSQINKAMEDFRHRLVVVFAGYTEPMQRLYQLEPGLESRITRTIDFPDYSIAELIQILNLELAARRMSLPSNSPESLYCVLSSELSAIITEKGSRNFGNARGIRNIVERMMDEHAYYVDANNIHGDAANTISLITAMQVFRSMYSSHPEELTDCYLNDENSKQQLEWIKLVDQAIAKGKVDGAYGISMGVLSHLEEDENHICLVTTDSSGVQRRTELDPNIPAVAMLRMYEAGKEITFFRPGVGTFASEIFMFLQGDFDEQTKALDLFVAGQRSILNGMIDGKSLSESLASLPLVNDSDVSRCPGCQRYVIFEKFCSFCGSPIQGIT